MKSRDNALSMIRNVLTEGVVSPVIPSFYYSLSAGVTSQAGTIPHFMLTLGGL